MDNIGEYRLSIFDQIHEIVFHGNGGYDYYTIYNMPIWLRNYTFKKLKDWFNKTNSQSKNEDSWVSGPTKEAAAKNKTIQVPTYVTKAAKK